MDIPAIPSLDPRSSAVLEAAAATLLSLLLQLLHQLPPLSQLPLLLSPLVEMETLPLLPLLSLPSPPQRSRLLSTQFPPCQLLHAHQPSHLPLLPLRARAAAVAAVEAPRSMLRSRLFKGDTGNGRKTCTLIKGAIFRFARLFILSFYSASRFLRPFYGYLYN